MTMIIMMFHSTWVLSGNERWLLQWQDDLKGCSMVWHTHTHTCMICCCIYWMDCEKLSSTSYSL